MASWNKNHIYIYGAIYFLNYSNYTSNHIFALEYTFFSKKNTKNFHCVRRSPILKLKLKLITTRIFVFHSNFFKRQLIGSKTHIQ